MAEWTRITGTLTGWNEENATAEDLLAAVQEVLPVDVCPTWFNRDNISLLNKNTRTFRTQNSYWFFCLPTVKTSEVPESEGLSVHLVAYVRDNAVFLGTDADSYVLDTHKPEDPAPDRKLDSWNTLHTSHCITYAEEFKNKAMNWLSTEYVTGTSGKFGPRKLRYNVASFYKSHVSAVEPKNNLNLYPPPCKGRDSKGNYFFRPNYLAVTPDWEYHRYGPYTYRSVDNPDSVYTQTHGCFFLLGDTEDYAPQAEPSQG